MKVCANTGPAASERSPKAAIKVFIFDLHRLNGNQSVHKELAGTVTMNCLLHVSREAELKELKNVLEAGQFISS
jgi:hypothetical protein